MSPEAGVLSATELRQCHDGELRTFDLAGIPATFLYDKHKHGRWLMVSRALTPEQLAGMASIRTTRQEALR